ncbi:MAG: hypothetical protein WC735_04710 [Candidatus Paceibacterota bacterium]|jgi:hypothetical protein
MDIRKIQQLKESPHAQTVIDWFNEEIEKMNNISTHKSWEEVLGKQIAEKILTDICRRLENKPEQIKVRNQYK